MNRDVRPPDLADVFSRLASMPGFLDAALARADRSLLARRAADGGFSLVEHACHLRDLEREGYLLRVMRLLAEDRPVLQGFAGDRIAEERDYQSQDAAAAARDFAAARAEVLRVARSLGAGELARAGEFAGRPVSLAGVLAMAGDHDAEHRSQIDRLLAELG
ncbi:MAG TPA: DinB family protein [Usitatibacteraceae bacterium]|nr:DinB family protein [Usitatibacteraceae bacterium]